MGWIFCKNNIKHIDSVKKLAIKAVETLGLDFGAVDVLFYNEKPYILEVNTAPGIEGSTLTNYANTFLSFMGLPDLKTESSTLSSSDGADVNITDVGDSDQAAVESALDLETVTLTIDRATARKLKALLAAVA